MSGLETRAPTAKLRLSFWQPPGGKAPWCGKPAEARTPDRVQETALRPVPETTQRGSNPCSAPASAHSLATVPA